MPSVKTKRKQHLSSYSEVEDVFPATLLLRGPPFEGPILMWVFQSSLLALRSPGSMSSPHIGTKAQIPRYWDWATPSPTDHQHWLIILNRVSPFNATSRGIAFFLECVALYITECLFGFYRISRCFRKKTWSYHLRHFVAPGSLISIFTSPWNTH